jgi:hypothetical protein
VTCIVLRRIIVTVYVSTRFFKDFYKDNKLVVEDMPTYGERNKLPDKAQLGKEKTVSDKIVQPNETVAHHYDFPEPHEDADGEEEYISGTVPASPPGSTRCPLTRLKSRFRARLNRDSMVTPEPCTDIPSEMEKTPVPWTCQWMQVDHPRLLVDGPEVLRYPYPLIQFFKVRRVLARLHLSAFA